MPRDSDFIALGIGPQNCYFFFKQLNNFNGKEELKITGLGKAEDRQGHFKPRY